MKTLEEVVAVLNEIRTGVRQPGVGDPQEQAGLFYYDEVLPIVIKAFCSDSSVIRQRLGRIDLLISMLGFSPETAILAHHALCPKRLLLLYSGNAISSIEVVRRFVVGQGPGQIAQPALNVRECPAAAPNAIIDMIVEAATEVRRQNSEYSTRIVVDITGGKKIMSAAAALAASRIGVPLVYIDGDYDPKLRRPRPGSERLIMIETASMKQDTL